MASIFERIKKNPNFLKGITPRTKESMQWFERKLRSMVVSRPQLIRSPELRQRSQLIVNRQLIGTMHMFKYDPAGKYELPYFDEFPLVIIVGPAKGGFKAINLHYLPPIMRIRFLDILYTEISGEDFTEDTRFIAFWNRLNKGLKKRYLRPMIRTYLLSQIEGRVAQVFPEEWEIAAFLPFQDFERKNKQFIWRNSMRMIREN